MVVEPEYGGVCCVVGPHVRTHPAAVVRKVTFRLHDPLPFQIFVEVDVKLPQAADLALLPLRCLAEARLQRLPANASTVLLVDLGRRVRQNQKTSVHPFRTAVRLHKPVEQSFQKRSVVFLRAMDGQFKLHRVRKTLGAAGRGSCFQPSPDCRRDVEREGRDSTQIQLFAVQVHDLGTCVRPPEHDFGQFDANLVHAILVHVFHAIAQWLVVQLQFGLGDVG